MQIRRRRVCEPFCFFLCFARFFQLQILQAPRAACILTYLPAATFSPRQIKAVGYKFTFSGVFHFSLFLLAKNERNVCGSQKTCVCRQKLLPAQRHSAKSASDNSLTKEKWAKGDEELIFHEPPERMAVFSLYSALVLWHSAPRCPVQTAPSVTRCTCGPQFHTQFRFWGSTLFAFTGRKRSDGRHLPSYLQYTPRPASSSNAAFETNNFNRLSIRSCE